jgi:probable F420-dependent oxidoreductase
MPLLEVAHAGEERGFDAIVLGEHTHIPISRESAFIGRGEMPDTYTRLIDPYIGLAFVAAQTSLKIGTCIALIAEHDPIALAKAIATLDYLSDGRVTLGVGYGWNLEELADHGHQVKDRRAIVREYIELMRSLWTETVAEYHGEHANLSPSWSWPKPAQPSIPVLLGAGAAGDRAIGDIVQWCDGWMPGGGNADWLAGRMQALEHRWIDAGRSEDGPITWAIQGEVDEEELRCQLDRLHSLGVAEVLLDIPTAERDEVLPTLDRYAKVLATSFS